MQLKSRSSLFAAISIANDSYENDKICPMEDDKAFEYGTEDAEVWHDEGHNFGSKADHN